MRIDKIDVAGKPVTADSMSMQEEIIDKTRKKDGYFLLGLKANQRVLRHEVEDKVKQSAPRITYTEGPELGHGRI